MTIVGAWDIGQSTGHAVGMPGRDPVVGTARMPAVVNDDQYGRRFDAFMKWGDDWLTVHKPTELFIEAPFAAQRRTGADLTTYIRAQFVYAGIAELLALRHGLRIWEVRVGDVRVHFCDDGHAKDAAIAAMCRSIGWAPANEHEADALALLHYGADFLELPTPRLPHHAEAA